ncbi:exodeoxyribonuclease VII large subunit [Methylophilus medardicus]|uniref:Exodeoxyribonuclease 7 large subunit n=1 Tax=Methylophilus medardicus TaxID=2588534 RepID=A0A5B8CR68_9PROT|nr:exodeoxyribonuclease VII large subunit [Methylophilus medardicus]QDC43774.1 exodeoxyribonuclease VII large subunit [Methylophilus medardicus]QDC48781.1 exodeoxyribonuclease VII large subunit [Methylophilus medardicus]QDC52486.1 exodeoxyribonuclease VII large subunit [Methylophilus medardicus]
MSNPLSTPIKQILNVSDLTRLTKELLETSFPLFWISGEISNFTRAASGHWYFSLKDDRAQVRCVMFKGRNSLVDRMPREGDLIEARATVTLYEARGDFQLTVEFMQPAGLGRLYEAFEQLKQRLQAEGLFDVSRKQTIPTNPQRIGVVTSPDAAALRDVLTAIRRRYPGMGVVIYPTPVQGKDAAARIAQAIGLADQRQEVDTLLICRGGGSIEDLWSFNEEVVARAVADCRLPTISGVGHETDFTIVDFVADLRAATPTAAAELACPDQSQLRQQVMQSRHNLMRTMQSLLRQHAQTLDYLSRRLISPAQQLQQQTQTVKQWQHRLTLAMQQQLHRQQRLLQSYANSLQQLNPHQVLARGYAIVKNAQGHAITDTAALSLHEPLRVTLHQGEAKVVVTQLLPPKA